MANIEHDRFELLFILYQRWSGVHHVGESIQTLASLLGHSENYIQQLIADLEDRALVTGVAASGDVAITQKGINLLDQVVADNPHLDPTDPQFVIP